jgi:uncharacterized metal-binding protein YceD (DUF177 family)
VQEVSGVADEWPTRERSATVRRVTPPSFVVRLADLERGPKRVSFPLTLPFLGWAFADTEVEAQGEGSLELELTKTGEEVMVRGGAQVHVHVPCVVTLDPLPFELKPEIFLLLYPEPKTTAAGEKGKNKGKRAGKRAEEPEPELSTEDAARDTYKGEEVVLDSFVREFLLLELPAYPRRSDLPSSEERLSSRPLDQPEASEKPVDPRLSPLLALAGRLKTKKE